MLHLGSAADFSPHLWVRILVSFMPVEPEVLEDQWPQQQGDGKSRPGLWLQQLPQKIPLGFLILLYEHLASYFHLFSSHI